MCKHKIYRSLEEDSPDLPEVVLLAVMTIVLFPSGVTLEGGTAKALNREKIRPSIIGIYSQLYCLPYLTQCVHECRQTKDLEETNVSNLQFLVDSVALSAEKAAVVWFPPKLGHGEIMGYIRHQHWIALSNNSNARKTFQNSCFLPFFLPPSLLLSFLQ